METNSERVPGGQPGWLRRVGNALLHFTLQRLESKVFRFALLTVLLVSAVHEFVGWKYVGVVLREAVVRVQEQALPWGGAADAERSLVAPVHKVATLLIGDDLFADPQGFGHRVPLLPKDVLRLLTAVLERVPAHTRIVIDFDLAPRVGEPPEPRAALDAWMAAHADRLLLVEPSWAARNAATLGRQLKWAWRMCRIDPNQPSAAAADGAVFVQSTLTSQFGMVVDSLPLSGAGRPAWDIGRAIAAPIAPGGQRRNPLCDRLRDGPAPASDASAPAPIGPLMLQLVLGKEFQQFGALRIAAQPAAAEGRNEQVLLRSEFLHADRACQPASFDDIASLPCLSGADVVLIGGAWSHGVSDLQDTFVGEVDGAVVHAAWIQSWLKPARHLNKVFDILLDVVIIECLLHPVLEFAFIGMGRRSAIYQRRMNFTAPHKGVGLHVTVMLGFVALAGLAFLGTVFTLIVFDGLLRWTFDRSLAVDQTILALLLWSAIALNGIGARTRTGGRDAKDPVPIVNLGWLVALCTISLATAQAAFGLAQVAPRAVPALVGCALVAAPLGFTVHAIVRQMSRPPATAEDVGVRWCAFLKHLRVLWGSLWLSLKVFGRPGSAPTNHWPTRLADAFGALLWLVLWGYGLWVFASSTLWGLMLELLKG